MFGVCLEMYKNCVYLKQKMNRTLFCKKQNKIINIGNCKSCKFHEFPENRKMVTTIKKRTNKQQKKEKERFSIIYQDLSKCCECECIVGIEKNEVFEGAYRQTSIKYGAVAPFCFKHHKQFHNDRLFNLKYKIKFQNWFISLYGYNWYIDKFKIDYEYLLNKKRTMD